MRQTRRSVLVYMGCVSGLPLMLAAGRGFCADTRVEETAAKLRALVADVHGARVHGRSYRAQFPKEEKPAVLTRLLCSSLQLGAQGIADLDNDALLSILDSRVREEFGSGDTVQVNGWVLARSEARLCALCK
jgi:hypothetical protein